MRQARDIWVHIIRQLEKSDLTQEAFALERGIPVHTLRGWIYRLRRERQDEATAILPVRVIASTAPTARRPDNETSAIEVVLGDSLLLRFPTSTPATAIAELVSLLRARC